MKKAFSEGPPPLYPNNAADVDVCVGIIYYSVNGDGLGLRPALYLHLNL